MIATTTINTSHEVLDKGFILEYYLLNIDH
jgi:hypothetical protein